MANKKDVCVIGMGKFGNSVVTQLLELNRFVLAIDIHEEKLIQASRITKTAICDARDIEALKNLGLANFKTVIVAATDNIEIIAAFIELGVKHIIAKAKSDGHERVLKQIGVDVIVRPEAEAGVRTALIATSPNFIKYSESLQEVGDGYAIGSTIVHDINYLGKPLMEMNLSRLGISIVSIRRGSKVNLPIGTFKLKSGDLVTIIGKIQNITKAFAEFNDESKTQILKLSKMSSASREANSKRLKEELNNKTSN